MPRLRKGEEHLFMTITYSVIKKFAFRWASWLKFADNNFTSHVFSFTKSSQFLQVYLLFSFVPATAFLNLIQYKVHVQINVYTNVPHTIHVLFILPKISKDIWRTCLRTFEADIPKIFENVQPQTKNSTF